MQPPMDGVCIGPQISECTISSGVHALYDFRTGKVSLCCLQKMQPSQTLFNLSINGYPFTIFFMCNNFIPPKFRCPNLKFHSHESSWTFVWKASWKSTLSFYFLLHCLSASLISTLNASHVFVFPFISGIILKRNKWFIAIGTFVISWLLGRMSLITQWLSSM